MYKNRFVPLAGTLLFLALQFANAQTSRGTVTGVISDATGAAIVGAGVELTGRETNVTRSTTTNESGLYRFDSVDIGKHDLNVKLSGFKSSTIRSFDVSGGQVASIDVKLEVGDVQTAIEVASDAILLQTEAPVRGANLTSAQVSQLPVALRNPVALALTVPGVSTNRYGRGTDTFIVNGARGRSNNFLLDGTENNDISVAGQGFQIKNPDAVQEVSVQTSNYDSEFGRAGGAVVNVITKSGTNQYHGTLGYLLDSTFDDAITNTQSLNPEVTKRGRPLTGIEQWYHGTFGGKIIRDRTFFFGSYQEQRQRSQSQGNVRIPSAAGRAALNSLFPKGTSANLDHFFNLVGPINATANFFPVALGAGRPDVQFGTSTFAYPQTLSDRQWTTKVDHRLSDKDQLTFRYATSSVDKPVNGENTSFPGLFTSESQAYHNALISETHVFSPSMTNELRLSYNRIDLGFPLNPENALGLTSPQYTIQGLTTAGQYSIGIRSDFPQGRIANNYVIQDTLTRVFGKHSLRAGFDLLKQRSRQFAPIPERGRFTYNQTTEFTGFANFIDDFAGAGGNSDRTFGNAAYYPELFRQAYFVQDRWRASQALTLSFGIRYENFGDPVNSIGKASWSGLFNIDPVTFDGPYRQITKVKPDRNNFAPMVGVAFSPSFSSGPLGWIFGDRKGVFRTGYGIGYDSFFNNIASNAAVSVPNAIATTTNVSVVTAAEPRGTPRLSSLLPTVSRAPQPNDAQTLVPGDLVNPYYQRWSAGLQRELPSNMLIDVSYVGSKGTKLFLNEQLNPTVPASMQILPNTSTPIPAERRTGRYDNLQGSRNIRTNGGDSNYHALQTQLTRRLSQGFHATASYTWSKLIDNGGDIFAIAQVNQTQNPSLPNFLGGLQRDRAVSVYDRTHRATFSYVYELPWMRTQRGFVGHVLGGWQLSGVTALESGVPLNVINGVDADGIDGAGDRPDFNPNGRPGVRAIPVALSVSPTGYVDPEAGRVPIDRAEAMYVGLPAFSGTTPRPTGNLGRNTLRTPGVANFDMSLLKRVAITERVGFELRGEAFNIFNHPQFGTPSISPFAPQVQQGLRSDVIGAPDGQFLKPNIADGGGRVLRYSVKLTF